MGVSNTPTPTTGEVAARIKDMRSLVALCWFSPAHSWRLPPPTLRRSHPVAELTEGDTLLTGESACGLTR